MKPRRIAINGAAARNVSQIEAKAAQQRVGFEQLCRAGFPRGALEMRL